MSRSVTPIPVMTVTVTVTVTVMVIRFDKASQGPVFKVFRSLALALDGPGLEESRRVISKRQVDYLSLFVSLHAYRNHTSRLASSRICC